MTALGSSSTASRGAGSVQDPKTRGLHPTGCCVNCPQPSTRHRGGSGCAAGVQRPEPPVTPQEPQALAGSELRPFLWAPAPQPGNSFTPVGLSELVSSPGLFWSAVVWSSTARVTDVPPPAPPATGFLVTLDTRGSGTAVPAQVTLTGSRTNAVRTCTLQTCSLSSHFPGPNHRSDGPTHECKSRV